MTKAIRFALGLSWLLLGTTALWAGDCSGPSDCSSPPDNASKAVVVVSIFAGAGLAFRSMNGSNGSDSQADNLADGNGDPGPLDATPPQPPAPKTINEPLGDPGDLPGGN
jgi:hypothetical protein